MRTSKRRNPQAPKISKQGRLAGLGLLCVLLLASLIPGAPSSFARQQPPESPSQPVPAMQGEAAPGNDVRTMFVAVLDKKGNAVSELKREDFSVRENGVPQEVLEVSPAGAMPLVVGVLVDVSGSLKLDNSRGKKLQALSIFFADTIGTSDEGFVVAFAEDQNRLTRFTNRPAELQEGLEKINKTLPGGGTTLYDCLVSAAESMQKERGGRRIIVVLTDFEDNLSNHSLEKTISRIQETGTAVFVLLETAQDPRRLRSEDQRQRAAEQVAQSSGGVVYGVESPKHAEAALRQIQVVVRNSYELKYRASSPPKKGQGVAVKVEVQRKDVKIIAAERRFSAAQ